MTTQDETEELKAFIKSLILNMRMNYGYAMTQAGIDADQIIQIHHSANDGMVDWLSKS